MFVSGISGQYPWIGIYGKGDKKYYDITTDEPVIFDGQADMEKYPWSTTGSYPEYENEPSAAVYVYIREQARWRDFDGRGDKEYYICENRYRELIIFFFNDCM